jgi:hypothetical protein
MSLTPKLLSHRPPRHPAVPGLRREALSGAVGNATREISRCGSIVGDAFDGRDRVDEHPAIKDQRVDAQRVLEPVQLLRGEVEVLAVAGDERLDEIEGRP